MKKAVTALICSAVAICSQPVPSNAQNIEFSDGFGQAEISEDMFSQTSTGYHRDIAGLASVLSCASYNDSTPDGHYINNAYRKLGFDTENDVTLFGYSDAENNADYKSTYDFSEDSLAFSLATREIGDERLLVIALRGTNLNSTSDILHDISIFGTQFCQDFSPSGFLSFFVKVSVGLDLYLGEHTEITESARQNKLKILVTGHSLGGAGANIIGTYFNICSDCPFSYFPDSSINKVYTKKLNIPRENIFTYTFACPNTYYGNPDTVDCDNVINVVNESDIIPQLPDGRKFGQYVYFDSNDSSGFSAHYGHKYTEAVESEIPDGVRYYGGGIDTVLSENILDGNGYNSKLSLLASALSCSAYKGKYSDGYYITSAYKHLGFSKDYISLYGYDSDDRCFSVAFTQTYSVPLLTVTFKGNTGNKDYPSEFLFSNYTEFSDTALNALDEYMSLHPDVKSLQENGDLNLLITGHGIGGAFAQATGSELIESGKFDKDRVFAYTFDCPAVLPESDGNSYPHFFNVLNSSTPESFVPFGTRYGSDLFFTSGEWGERNYDPDVFADAVESEKIDPNYSYKLISLDTNSACTELTKHGKTIPLNECSEYFQYNNSDFLLLSGSDSYTLRVSGNDSEKASFGIKYGKNGKSEEISYKNVNTENRTVEYRIGDGIDSSEMVVLDAEGKPSYLVHTDGTETKYTESKSLKKIPFAVSGAVLLSAVVLVFLGKNTRKKSKNQ